MWRGWRRIGLPRESMQEYAGSQSMGKPQKRWIHTIKECLKKEEGKSKK